MDNQARRSVHELASRFKIKSKSTGAGKQRRPVLYRNKRTLPYNANKFDTALSQINRRYFPRMDKNDLSPVKRRTGYSATAYRDGDVVGAHAPELGAENRGRAMLEKMGWSRGTALGANNEGILLPVPHIMKRTKAGLC
jgi:hypothetical protein